MAELPATRHPWSDAWLLFSFPELITRADGIQHAVPSFDEVDGGLARLSSAGLVRVSRGHVGLTPGGLALVSRTASPRRPLLNWQEELERALKAAPWSAEYTPVTAHRDPSLAAVTSREEYAEALRRSGR